MREGDAVRGEYHHIVERDVVLSLAFQYVLQNLTMGVVLPERIVKADFFIIVGLPPVVLVGIAYEAVVALDLDHIYAASDADDVIDLRVLFIVEVDVGQIYAGDDRALAEGLLQHGVDALLALPPIALDLPALRGGLMMDDDEEYDENNRQRPRQSGKADQQKFDIFIH